MALTVEDGSVVPGAESYCSVADASAYHTARGNAAWVALTSDTLREQALRRATAYMVQAYRSRWAGYRFSAAQALDWPRAYVPLPDAVSGYGAFEAMVAPDVVPVEVRDACAELALRAAAGTLLADQTRAVVRSKVGPIETEYDPYSPQAARYVAVDAMVAVYFRKGGAVRVVRA